MNPQRIPLICEQFIPDAKRFLPELGENLQQVTRIPRSRITLGCLAHFESSEAEGRGLLFPIALQAKLDEAGDEVFVGQTRGLP